MILPVIILAVALLAAATTAFGADPGWAQFPHGIQFIMLTRRLEWPLLALTITACLSVIAMIVGGKWRAWWLIGLVPILTLFAHRYAIDPTRSLQITDQPTFVSADEATFLADDDYVVGLTFDGESYAYPYSVLYRSPVVVQADREERLMLIWSAFANRAVASPVDRTLKPRELEIVSIPANSLLLYNSRLGQFINGVTGLTIDNQRPTGFGAQVPTVKMPWKDWRAAHRRTRVMRPTAGWNSSLPNRPVLPCYPMPRVNGPKLAPGTMAALVQLPQPAVVDEAAVGTLPLNLVVNSEPVLLIRDGNGVIKAYLRQANGDLTPKFFPVPPVHPAGTILTEKDSGSFWALDGRALDGPLKGEKLKPFEVDDDVYLDVIRFWYPKLSTITPAPGDAGQAPDYIAAQTASSHGTPRVRRRRPRAISAQRAAM